MRQAITCGTNNLWIWYAIERPATLGFWHKPASACQCRIAKFGVIEPILFYGEDWLQDRHNELFTFAAGRSADAEDHPCPKPLTLWSELLNQYSVYGELFVDPFTGSGTSLVAAEDAGRRCVALEINPSYCEISIRRWQAATGKPAILKETGEIFDPVAKEGDIVDES